MVFGGDAYHAVFTVPPRASCEMVDDDPLGVRLPETALPIPPSLDLGPILQSFLETVVPAGAAPGAASGGRRGASARRPRAPDASGPVRPRPS